MAEKLDKYLMGLSALFYFWKVPDLIGTILSPGMPIGKEFLVFVEKGKSLYTPKGFNLHATYLKAVKLWARGNVCLPELCFVQACRHLNKWQAVLLGNQLCSRYPDRRPLCTQESLKACIDMLDYYPGVVMARWALQYIRPHAASPMESKQSMCWSLPVCHGGCAFRHLEMNQPAYGASGKRYYLDFSMPGKKLDLEFNGKAHHSSPEQIASDLARRKDLEAAGYTVVSCEYEDVVDKDRIAIIIKKIIKAIGKKVRVRAHKYFLGYWMIQDILAQRFIPPRDQYSLISEGDYPDLPGTGRSYAMYRKKRKERLDQLRVDFSLDWRESSQLCPT